MAATPLPAFLAQLELVYPGISAEWADRATLSAPAIEPLLLGPYSTYCGIVHPLPGRRANALGKPHFGGGYCSIDVQAFMAGAGRGARAAREILENVGRVPTAHDRPSRLA